MKTNLFLLGMAVAALSSCTNEELTDVAQNRAIKFNPFVENNTKAVEEVSSLSSFYVFGEYGDSDGSYGTQIFNNEEQGTTYYWVAGKYYSFGAYADGVANVKLDNVAFNANDRKLTFTDYTPDDAKDLVAAVAKTGPANGIDDAPVSLTFKHMLSQVKFTFNTTDGDQYVLAISNIQFNASKKATGVYPGTNDQVTWTEVSKGDYIYTQEIADVANASQNYTASSESKLVIPQNGTNNIEVTFTAKITGPGLEAEGKTGNFKSTLAVAEDAVGGVNNDANTWLPGYKYNYTATIKLTDIDPEGGYKPITFTPSVEGWETAGDQTTNPQKQQ